MAAIDYGTMLRVNGKFINRNKNIFDEGAVAYPGYIPKQAIYKNDKVDIEGNFFLYAGNEELLLAFWKTEIYVISHEEITNIIFHNPFLSETVFCKDTKIQISHLDKKYQTEEKTFETWFQYVKENWTGATGNEKDYELQDGKKRHKIHRRWCKRQNRYPGFRYLTSRYLAEWEHDGNHYEVIFGYGIDSQEEVWSAIKKGNVYDFTEIEKGIIDDWFK